MFENLIAKKSRGEELNMTEYYNAVDYLVNHGIDRIMKKFFLCLNSFGMTNREVLYLTMAIRDSGRVLKHTDNVLEKHSTGGVGDPTSIVLVPLLASMGYKIIKNTAKSLVFTNGSADRFGAIPGFKTILSNEEIQGVLASTNACILSHNGDFCPADKILHELREKCGIADDENLIAASIAAKKLASGANVVLVDVKYGEAAMIKTYKQALNLAKILKYVFNKCEVKSVIFVTDTTQMIGEGVGNAIEVVDALKVLQGRKCLLRDVVTSFAKEMILKANPHAKKKEVVELINSALDNGYAYNSFMEIVKAQGGDAKVLNDAKLFRPYKSVNFVAERDGYVGNINSYLLGELIRRLCVDSHDSNIGVMMRVKVGDYVHAGDIIVSFYYKDEKDFEKYKQAIIGCVRVTSQKFKPVKIVKRIIK